MKVQIIALVAALLASSKVVVGSDIPTCADPLSDTDGDGWGWEQEKSCSVEPLERVILSACINPQSDSDGDGFGWENDSSCIVTAELEENDEPINCQFSTSDMDGDGFGFENNRSCIMADRYFVDSPVGTSLGNPQPLALNEVVSGSLDGSGSWYYSLEITSTVALTVTATGRLSYVNIWDEKNSFGGSGGLGPYTKSTLSTNYCLAPGTYQIEVVRPENYTLKAEQTATTPCMTVTDFTEYSDPNNYRPPEYRGSNSFSPYTLIGFDDDGITDWGFYSDRIISSVRKGGDGLFYVYVSNDDAYTFPATSLSLYVLDPYELVSDEQRSQATLSVTPPTCASDVSDTDNDGWGYEDGTSCVVPDIRVPDYIAADTGPKKVQVGQTVSGTIGQSEDGRIYAMTLTEDTALSIELDQEKTGAAYLFLRNAIDVSRRYRTLYSAESNHLNFPEDANSMCLKAGTYLFGIYKNNALTSDYSFSVRKADLRCTKPIHIVEDYPNYPIANYRASYGVPSTQGVIYHITNDEPVSELLALDWQGNKLWGKQLNGYIDTNFGVTSNGNVYILETPDDSKLPTNLIAYSSTGEELWTKSYYRFVDAVVGGNTVLVIPFYGSAIEAYNPDGTPRWLHSPPPTVSSEYSYKYFLLDREP